MREKKIHKDLISVTKTLDKMGFEVTFDGETINEEKFRIFNKNGKYFIQFAYDLDPVLAGVLTAKLVKKYDFEIDWDYFYVNDDRSYVYHGDVECEEAYLMDMRKRILKEMLDSK